MTVAKWRVGLCLFGVGLAGAAGVSLGGSPALPTVVPTRIPPADAAPEAALVPVQYLEPAPKPEPSVALDWVGPPAMRRGRQADYSLMVKNTCGQTVQKVVVQVKAPVVVGVVKTSPAAQVVEGVQLWELGSLAPGEGRELKLTLDPKAGTDEQCQAWVTFTGTAGLKITVEEAKIEAKLTCPVQARVGEPMGFWMGFASTGTCGAKDVTYTILDGQGREVVKDQPVTGFGGCGNVCDCNLNTTYTLTKRGPAKFTLVVTSPDLAEPVTATCECVGVAPELVVTLDAPAEHPVGKSATCRATVTNVGDAPAANLGFDVSEAGGWTFGLQSPPPAGPVAPGARVGVVLVGHAERAGPARFEVVATADGAKSAAGSATTRVVGYPALRVELLDTVDPVQKGAETVYEIKVTNTGTMADGQIVLTCPIPEQLELVKADGPVPAKVETLNELTVVRFEPVRELAPGTAMTYRVVAKAKRSGDVRFQARLTSEHLTSSVTKEESTRVYGD